MTQKRILYCFHLNVRILSTKRDAACYSSEDEESETAEQSGRSSHLRGRGGRPDTLRGLRHPPVKFISAAD